MNSFCFLYTHRQDGSSIEVEPGQEEAGPCLNWSHVADLIQPIRILLTNLLTDIAAHYQIKVISYNSGTVLTGPCIHCSSVCHIVPASHSFRFSALTSPVQWPCEPKVICSWSQFLQHVLRHVIQHNYDQELFQTSKLPYSWINYSFSVSYTIRTKDDIRCCFHTQWFKKICDWVLLRDHFIKRPLSACPLGGLLIQVWLYSKNLHEWTPVLSSL